MKFLKDNKGLLIFYLCMSLVMMFWVTKVEKENDMIGKIPASRGYANLIHIDWCEVLENDEI